MWLCWEKDATIFMVLKRFLSFGVAPGGLPPRWEHFYLSWEQDQDFEIIGALLIAVPRVL